jgi:nucleoside phosphorylase
MIESFPLFEFDEDRSAIIEPHHLLVRRDDFPEHAVICFFYDVLDNVRERETTEIIGYITSEAGPTPLLRIEVDGVPIVAVQPGVGAPMAAAVLEELIALGARKVVACGGAGVLDREIGVGHLVIPTSAVRDEGTSFHYVPPSREIVQDPDMVTAIATTLDRHGIGYRLEKTWTTDAIYRETRGRVERRRSEGCATVEMEASALFAVGAFRGVPVGQILYGGDDVSGLGDWDPRDWDKHVIRERLFWLAAESCLAYRPSPS